MRVLVIEDEPTLCDVYEDFLVERGHKATIAKTAEAALETLESDRPDAVILDIHLPGMSGLDLMRTRLTHEPGLPVIVISGAAGEQQVEECLALGAREFIAKPVSLEHLGDAIDALTDPLSVDGSDRRRNRRVAVSLPISVVGSDGREVSGSSVDLSVTGIRVRMPDNVDAAEDTTIKLTVSQPVYLELPSKAVRVGPGERAYRFVDLDEQKRAQLTSILTPSVPSATARVAPHFSILHSITEAATGAIDTETALAVALEALTHLTGHETSSLHLLDEDNQTLVLRGERGLSPELRRVNEKLRIGEGLIGRVAATGETCHVANVLHTPDLLPEARSAVHRAGGGALLSVAITSHGRTFGVLSLGRLARDDAFSPAEVTLVEASARQIGLALENTRLAAEARRRLEALQRAEAQLTESARLSTIGQLAAGLAHDVASPLTAILGHVELILLEAGHNDDTRNRLSVVLEEATRAAKLLHSLMRVARPQAPERIECALDREATLVLSLMDVQLRRAGVRVITLFDDVPPIWADPGQIRQVVLNLIQNAAHALAAFSGERVLTVRIRAVAAGVRLEIVDSGPGIPADLLPRIFEAFFTTKPAGEGTGLGLWVSGAIVAAHEGRIWAENRPEGGAGFIVELPSNRPEEWSGPMIDLPSNGA